MSNTLFENPKVALGFSGVVVAVALVASVAFQEFSGSDDAPEGAVAAAAPAQAASQPAQAGFASDAASGWAGDAGATDDWGAPSASSQNGGFSEVPGPTNDAPVFGDHVSKKMEGGGFDRSSGPKITTSAAPGAPEVRPPETGYTPDIQIKGN